MIKQLSIFIENKVGTTQEVTELLCGANINMRAFLVFDTTEFTIMRTIVDDVDKAQKLLEENGFFFKVIDVLGIEIPDVPGAINSLLKVLRDENFSVNYIYTLVIREERTPLIVTDVGDNESAERMLKSKGYTLA